MLPNLPPTELPPIIPVPGTEELLEDSTPDYTFDADPATQLTLIITDTEPAPSNPIPLVEDRTDQPSPLDEFTELRRRRQLRTQYLLATRGKEPTLKTLVEQAQNDQPGAFDELVRQTHSFIYTLAHRICGDVQTAEDVTQDAYLRAYGAIKKFRGDTDFRSWMYRITANAAATRLGRAHRRHEVPYPDKKARYGDDTPFEETIADPDVFIDPEARAETGDDREELQAALRELPDKARGIVVLRDIYDLSTEEVRGIYDMSESAVKVSRHRSLRSLRDHILNPPSDPVDTPVTTGVPVKDTVGLELTDPTPRTKQKRRPWTSPAEKRQQLRAATTEAYGKGLLTEQAYEVLQLHTEGLSNTDLANKLGTTVDTAKMRLSRARREALKDREGSARPDRLPRHNAPAQRAAELALLDTVELDTLPEPVRNMSPALRAVIVLSEMEGLADQAIAERLNINVMAVRTRLHRARKQLQKYRKELGELPTETDLPQESTT